jgi:hypothetical protein
MPLNINGQTLLPEEERTVKELYPGAKGSDAQLKVEKGSLVLGMITLNVR